MNMNNITANIRAISKKTRAVLISRDGEKRWISVDENIDLDKVEKGKAVLMISEELGKPLITEIIQQAEEKQEQDDDEKWLKKDKRISRLALLNTSIELYKLYGGEVDFNKANKNQKQKTIEEIISIARELEKYVWGD